MSLDEGSDSSFVMSSWGHCCGVVFLGCGAHEAGCTEGNSHRRINHLAWCMWMETLMLMPMQGGVCFVEMASHWSGCELIHE